MIERFNFYDVYGYLIPGVALVIVCILPFAVTGKWPEHAFPSGEVSSVIIAVAIAYVLGYFLQSMATNAIPSSFDGKYPSTSLLDASDKRFTSEFKNKIAEKARREFDLDLAVTKDATGGGDPLSRIRQDAFFRARPIINPKEFNSYSEQHQGLYSMMRGLVIACSIGCFFTAGWAAALWQDNRAHLAADGLVALVAASTAILAFMRFRQKLDDPARIVVDRLSLTSIAFGFLPGGYIIGSGATSVNCDFALWVLAVFYFAAALRFYVSYHYFSVQFALSVWRSFLARSGAGN